MRLASLSPLPPEYTEQLLELYADVWWTKSRTIVDVEAMLASTPVTIGLVDNPKHRLAAFARVLTDDVYFAMILDVIVDARYRGTGLGRALMDAVLAHPRVSGVKSVELVCQPDLIAFYEKWGFTDDVGTSLLMRRRDPAGACSDRSAPPSWIRS
jgi:predicted GNAT family N-acyltransferase